MRRGWGNQSIDSGRMVWMLGCLGYWIGLSSGSSSLLNLKRARNSHPSRVLCAQGPGQSPPQEKENAPPVLLAPVGATAVAAHLSTRPSNAAAPATGRGSAEPTWLIPRVLPWRVYANSILLFFYCPAPDVYFFKYFCHNL